jgi:hypothetical protein
MAGMQDYIFTGKEAIGSRFEVDKNFLSMKITGKAVDAKGAVDLGIEIPDDGVVWPVEFCGDGEDRQTEIIPKPILDIYASQINTEGFSLNLFHTNNLCGHVLEKAMVVKNDKGNNVLRGYIWVDNVAVMDDQPKMTVNRAIEKRTIREVSIEISGHTEAIDDGHGGRAYQYYVDENKPERTEILGLALVRKGAQRTQGIKVKSLDGNKNPENENSKPENMQFDKEYEAGGKSFRVHTEKAGDGIVLKGMNEAIEAHKAAEIAKTKAESEKATAEAATVAANAEAATYKAAVVTEITQYQAILKTATPKTVAELEALKAADLLALRAEMVKAVAGAETKTKEVAANTDMDISVKELKY